MIKDHSMWDHVFPWGPWLTEVVFLRVCDFSLYFNLKTQLTNCKSSYRSMTHKHEHWMWCFISQEKQTHTWKNNVHHLWRLSVPLHDCLSKKKGLLCISIFHLPLYFLLCFFGTRQVSKTQYKYTIPSNFIQVNLSAYTSITWQWFVSRFFNTIK